MSQKSAATQACRIGSQTWMRQTPENPNGLLNVQNYKLCMSLNGMFLSDYNSFTLPSKLYGVSNIENITNRVLHTFHATNKNLGVLLSGLKGTGKSIQLKHIAQNSNMPVIIVDELFEGPQLLSFIDSLPQSCVIVFDEFEKVYADRAENNILSVLDGLSTSAHIFVLTVNGEVSEFMQSRPSRIRYLMNYSGLKQDTIKEIVNDRLDTKAAHHMNDLMTYFECFDDINLDTVVSLISEVNLYPNDKFDNIVSIFNLPNPLDQEYEFHIPTVALVYDKDTPTAVLNDIKQFMSKNGNMPYNYEHVLNDYFNETVLFFEKVRANFPEYVSIVDIALTTTKKFSISEFKYNCEISNNIRFRESYTMGIPYTHKLLIGLLNVWVNPYCNEVTFKKTDRGSFSISLDNRECVIASRSIYKQYMD